MTAAKTKSLEVVVKQQHPTGVYRRAGIEFTRTPKVLEVSDKEAGILTLDPWLVAIEVKPEKKGGKAVMSDA